MNAIPTPIIPNHAPAIIAAIAAGLVVFHECDNVERGCRAATAAAATIGSKTLAEYPEKSCIAVAKSATFASLLDICEISDITGAGQIAARATAAGIYATHSNLAITKTVQAVNEQNTEGDRIVAELIAAARKAIDEVA